MRSAMCLAMSLASSTMLPILFRFRHNKQETNAVAIPICIFFLKKKYWNFVWERGKLELAMFFLKNESLGLFSKNHAFFKQNTQIIVTQYTVHIFKYVSHCCCCWYTHDDDETTTTTSWTHQQSLWMKRAMLTWHRRRLCSPNDATHHYPMWMMTLLLR